MFQLSKANEGERVVVMRISEYAENVSELLEYLGKRGIVPNATLTITEVAPLKGPLTFKVGNKTVSLSREVAGYVWVKRE
jgi:Fe2+ transport system protein FeoA